MCARRSRGGRLRVWPNDLGGGLEGTSMTGAALRVTRLQGCASSQSQSRESNEEEYLGVPGQGILGQTQRSTAVAPLNQVSEAYCAYFGMRSG